MDTTPPTIEQRVLALEAEVKGIRGWMERMNAIELETQHHVKKLDAKLTALSAALDAKLDLLVHLVRGEVGGG